MFKTKCSVPALAVFAYICWQISVLLSPSALDPSRNAVSNLAATGVSLQQSRRDYKVPQAVFMILFCSNSTAASWGSSVGILHAIGAVHQDTPILVLLSLCVQIYVAHWKQALMLPLLCPLGSAARPPSWNMHLIVLCIKLYLAPIVQ